MTASCGHRRRDHLGAVDGQIDCGSRLQIAATAVVSGEIKTPILVIEDGATVNCRFSMARTGVANGGPPMTAMTAAAATAVKSSPASAGIEASESRIDKDSHFNGLYETKQNLRIEGLAEGEIQCEGTLTVAEGARVKAKVTASTITIAGELDGEVAVPRRLSDHAQRTGFSLCLGQPADRPGRRPLQWRIPHDHRLASESKSEALSGSTARESKDTSSRKLTGSAEFGRVVAKAYFQGRPLEPGSGEDETPAPKDGRQKAEPPDARFLRHG